MKNKIIKYLIQQIQIYINNQINNKLTGLISFKMNNYYKIYKLNKVMKKKICYKYKINLYKIKYKNKKYV